MTSVICSLLKGWNAHRHTQNLNMRPNIRPYCRPVSVMSPSLPYPAQLSLLTWSSHLHYSEWVVVLCYFVAKGRNVHLTYARSFARPADCNIGRIATPLPKCGIASSNACARTDTVTHCHVWLSRAVTMVSCPSLCTRPCLCHSVSAWLKQVCMQRAMPQLSEMEMGFDFHNPVAWVRRGP